MIPDPAVIGLTRLGDRPDVLSPPSDRIEISSNRFIKRGFSLMFRALAIATVMGSMSVVGSRPHMAQVKGFRGGVVKPRDLRHRARLDDFHVVFWILTMDLQVVVMTILAMIKPPNTTC